MSHAGTSPAVMADLERVRELRGDLSLEEIFKSTLSLYLDRTDLSRRLNKSQSSQSTPTLEPTLESIDTPPEQSTPTSELALESKKLYQNGPLLRRSRRIPVIFP